MLHICNGGYSKVGYQCCPNKLSLSRVVCYKRSRKMFFSSLSSCSRSSNTLSRTHISSSNRRLLSLVCVCALVHHAVLFYIFIFLFPLQSFHNFTKDFFFSFYDHVIFLSFHTCLKYSLSC